MAQFDHERLDAYQVAIDFVALVDDVVESLPRGRGHIADQLQRASLSVALNIAEGAGEFSSKDKKGFYRMALRSATESAAILDVCGRLDLTQDEVLSSGRDLLLRIVSMLTRLVLREEEPGTGTGTGTSRSEAVPKLCA